MEEYSTNLDLAIDQFWDTVPRLWNIIRGHVRAIAAEQFGISVEQFHVLRHIRKGLTSVKDIAEARQISRPAISQAAETLVEKGLITRHEAPLDRRYVHLALTAEGQALLEAIFAQNRDWMRKKMAALSVEELETLHDGLKLLKVSFDQPVE
jgi:DNA-binding MarR family transcriptional regulator